MEHDLVIAGGRVATPMGLAACDLGIREGRIATLGTGLAGAERLDASGLLVLPGGIETHCHLHQEGGSGLMGADGYRSGSISAAMGGTSTIVPFAAKTRDRSVAESLDLYAARAEGESVLDWANHLIVPDAGPETLAALPEAFARGVTALKVFTTYPAVMAEDAAILELMCVAKAHGALTMVHAENHAMIRFMTGRLRAAGHDAPEYHAPSHPALAEEEAIGRLVAFSKLLDAPVLIVHVSTPGGAALVAKARAEGVRVWAETCTQYVTLTRDDLRREGREGAKFVCSPPPRDAAAQAGIWRHLAAGTFATFSSDHAPYRFDETGKFANGADAPFDRIANGVPGLAARLPILFSEGVMKGRITLARFVELSAANAARIYGLAGKGSLAPGMDADIALWDPGAKRTITQDLLGDAMDYTPYEGLEVRGWPMATLSRGRVVMREGEIPAEPGSGRRLARVVPDLSEQPGWTAPEMDPETAFGARLMPPRPADRAGA